MNNYNTLTFVFVPVLFIGMMALLTVGHRMGKRRLASETEQERVGLVSIETAIFGLLGLMFAFTYSGAASRFEQRRVLGVQEANAMGTAYLRLDLLPPAAQPAIRDKMKRYAKVHLAAYDALPDYATFGQKLSQAKAMQAEIWSDTVAALKDAPPPASQLLLPALNDLIDITGTHEALTSVRTPPAVLGSLMLLALFSSLLAGYGLAGSQLWSRYLHMFGFAMIVTGTIYLMVDYDYPRSGLVTLDFSDKVLEEAVAAMK
jgi:hypothetical protein